MELNAVDVAMLDHGGERGSVLGRRGRRGDDGSVVAVGEVDVRFIAGTLEQSRFAEAADVVPAHVRDARRAGEARDPLIEEAEAAHVGRLIARGEQSLQAETDS